MMKNLTLLVLVTICLALQLLVVRGGESEGNEIGNPDPDATVADLSNEAAQNREDLLDATFNGDTLPCSGALGMLDDPDGNDNVYEFKFSPGILADGRLLVGEWTEVKSVVSVQVILLDDDGNRMEYRADSHDLGYLVSITQLTFVPSSVRCLVTLLANIRLNPQTLFFHFSRPPPVPGENGGGRGVITGDSSFSIDSMQQTFSVSIRCPSGATCNWLLDDEVIYRKPSAFFTFKLNEKYVGNRTLSYVAWRGRDRQTLASLQLIILPRKTPAPSCRDKTKNNNETDVDCGGRICSKRCGINQTCASDTDCANKNCHRTLKTCQRWITTGSMNVARACHTATQLSNGSVLVVGGVGNFTALNSAELYDPATTNWIVTGLMQTERLGHTATLLSDGLVLVVGGSTHPSYSKINASLASAELYNPKANTWSLIDSMNTPRVFHTATLLRDGSVLVTGGYTTSVRDGNGGYPRIVLNSSELYNSTARTWRIIQSMNIARAEHTATLLPNGSVLVVAGWGRDTLLNTAELYNPITNIWTAVSSMNISRAYHTATLLLDRYVLVVGGFYDYSIVKRTNSPDGGNNNSSRLGKRQVISTYANDSSADADDRPLLMGSVERYDTVGDNWTNTEWMHTIRFGQTACRLPNELVLVAGGNVLNVSRSNTESYDPATGNWTLSDPMNITRAFHTATLLRNGFVLIAGGIRPDSYESEYLPFNSTERYSYK